jgi:hypothetical protein
VNLDELYRSVVIDETLNLFDMLQNEEHIPPMYSCIQVAHFALVNILAAYKRQDKEPPIELLQFIAKTIPELQSQQDSFIHEQYLTLNTEGTA